MDTRKWKADFAWPDIRLLVEIEGGTRSGRSRHTKGEGFQRDCEKYNTAALLGWVVLRFTSEDVEMGRALSTVEAYMEKFPGMVSIAAYYEAGYEAGWNDAKAGREHDGRSG